MPEFIEDIQIDEIKRRVQRALENFRCNEWALLKPLASERNISQRLSKWLEFEFEGWNIDCEYNQIVDGTNGKAIVKVASMLMQRVKGGFIFLDEPKELIVVPDIIIHKGHTQENLLAIEIKTSNNQEEIQFDLEKLHAYREHKRLNYRFALFIRFQEPREDRDFIGELTLF